MMSSKKYNKKGSEIPKSIFTKKLTLGRIIPYMKYHNIKLESARELMRVFLVGSIKGICRLK